MCQMDSSLTSRVTSSRIVLVSVVGEGDCGEEIKIDIKWSKEVKRMWCKINMAAWDLLYVFSRRKLLYSHSLLSLFYIHNMNLKSIMESFLKKIHEEFAKKLQEKLFKKFREKNVKKASK